MFSHNGNHVGNISVLRSFQALMTILRCCDPHLLSDHDFLFFWTTNWPHSLLSLPTCDSVHLAGHFVFLWRESSQIRQANVKQKSKTGGAMWCVGDVLWRMGWTEGLVNTQKVSAFGHNEQPSIKKCLSRPFCQNGWNVISHQRMMCISAFVMIYPDINMCLT